jgi:phthalate 4,5-dioxygenase
MQRHVNYSGISGIHLQDQAITESMGEITDFSFEHLAPSDLAVTRTRKRLLAAARANARTGTAPPGALHPEICAGARGGEFLAPAGQDMRRAYDDAVRASTDPTGTLLPAAAE